MAHKNTLLSREPVYYKFNLNEWILRTIEVRMIYNRYLEISISNHL